MCQILRNVLFGFILIKKNKKIFQMNYSTKIMWCKDKNIINIFLEFIIIIFIYININ